MNSKPPNWLTTIRKFERGFVGLFGIAVGFLALSIILVFLVEPRTATYAITQVNLIILSAFVLVDGSLIILCRKYGVNEPESSPN